ncbi:hypothetical protein ON010_g2528 [Phytophthora cinnamomi]|nr:hypothetical protein ON010_g2528 [Phytophthora cinnamomi]
MARWLSFFAEYNFRVEYKPGRLNVVADALSRRPGYAEAADVHAIDAMRTSTPTSTLLDDVKATYAHDADTKLLLAYGTTPSDKTRQKLPKHLRACTYRYWVHDGLLLYNAVDDHDLRLRMMYECHDAPSAGHLGREKTYVLLTRDFCWHHQYKWVAQAPLQSLPTPSECWKSMSLDFIFGLPPDSGGNTGVVVFVDRFSKMVHLAALGHGRPQGGGFANDGRQRPR